MKSAVDAKAKVSLDGKAQTGYRKIHHEVNDELTLASYDENAWGRIPRSALGMTIPVISNEVQRNPGFAWARDLPNRQKI
jgi:hypothetical protein